MNVNHSGAAADGPLNKKILYIVVVVETLNQYNLLREMFIIAFLVSRLMCFALRVYNIRMAVVGLMPCGIHFLYHCTYSLTLKQANQSSLWLTFYIRMNRTNIWYIDRIRILDGTELCIFRGPPISSTDLCTECLL